MRPPGIIVLIVIQAILAVTSISGGKILLDDPSGSTLGLQPLVPYLPFGPHNYTAVGVWLIVAYGALPLALAAGLWFKKFWAWAASLGLGAVLVIWIVSEIIMFYSFGFTFFYPLIGGIGAVMIVILCMPPTRRYFAKP
ncbi:MAG: hypothetical protein ABI347_01805 [Nitrososphaera sp.]|jgi:hypothetical protein